MLHILLLAVQAFPVYVPYNGQVVPIDYDSATDKLAVGSDERYVQKILDMARWEVRDPAGWKLDGGTVGSHQIKRYRLGKNGVYVVHATSGREWQSYVPDVKNIRQVEANLDSLLAMYTGISQSPGMQSKNLFDFVVPKVVQPLLQAEDPSTQEIITALPVLSPTFRALQKTHRALQNVRLWEKHDGEYRALGEQHQRQRAELVK